MPQWPGATTRRLARSTYETGRRPSVNRGGEMKSTADVAPNAAQVRITASKTGTLLAACGGASRGPRAKRRAAAVNLDGRRRILQNTG